jgi:hypothetical protein
MRGARLVLPANIALADVVYVIFGNVCKPARVVWRDKVQVGVQFIEDEGDPA